MSDTLSAHLAAPMSITTKVVVASNSDNHAHAQIAPSPRSVQVTRVPK